MKFLKFFILVFTFNVSTSIWKGSPVDWLGTALVCQSSGLSIWIVFQQTASIAQLRLAALVQILVGLSAVIVFADRMDDYGHSWGDVVMLCCIAGGLAAIFESNTLEKLKNAGLRRSLSLGFIWPFSSSAFLARQSARLSDEDLMAAYQLSDHTQQAKHAITDELARRQIRPEIFRNWLPPQSEATLPPVFRAPIRKKTYKRMVRIHIFTTVIIRLMCAVIILFASLLVLAGVQHLIKTETFSAAALLLVLTKAIAAFFFFGILFLLPIHVFVLIGAVHGRRKCARILLLRPFGQKDWLLAISRG